MPAVSILLLTCPPAFAAGQTDIRLSALNLVCDAIRTSGHRQAYFAGLTGLSQPYLSRVLRGKRTPTLRALDRLASAVGLRVVAVSNEG